jgi:NTE family protein
MRRTRIIAAVLFAFLPAAAAGSAAEKPLHFTPVYTLTHGGIKSAVPPAQARTLRIGIALSGGGAKSAASIGVLRVLAREGIPVSAVAGTSMGAIVGGMYSAGYSPDEMERIFTATDWNDIFTDTPPRAFQTVEQKRAGSRHLLEFSFLGGRFLPPPGFTAGQKLTTLLSSKTLAASFQAGRDFDRLIVPFRAVAADIETGDEVVIRSGLLHDAMRASAALPFLFQPVEIGGRLLVDGGTVNNLPVDVVKTMNVDYVIAVDVADKPQPRQTLTTMFDVMNQSIGIQIRKESQRQAARADLVIAPDTSDLSFFDFPRLSEIILAGENAARSTLPEIRERIRAGIARREPPVRYRIASLAVSGALTVPESDLRTIVARTLPASGAMEQNIQETLAAVFRLGWFSDVALDLSPGNGGYRAALAVVENPVVEAVEISGNSLVPSGEIMAELEGQLGVVLNSVKVADALDRVVARYRAKGFLLVRVERAGLAADGSTLEIVMNEGRVDDIRLAGQKRTRPSLLRREIQTREGQPLNFTTLEQDVQHLYGLSYFESLNVDMADNGADGVDLTFRVREKPRATVRLGLRYDLEDAFTGLVDVAEDNITGRGIRTSLTMLFGNYTDLTLRYFSPVLFRLPFAHAVQAYYRERDYFLYADREKTGELNISRLGADVSFGYQWFKFGDSYIRYRFESAGTDTAIGTAAPDKEARIGSWAFVTSVDTRDSSTFPSKGVFVKGMYETAEPAYGGDIEFVKTNVSGQAYLSPGARHTFLFEAAAGLGSGDLPYQEQYGIGGADYVLGFPLLGFQRREFTGPNFVGFQAAYRWKIAEYQLKLGRALYVNVAGQAANVWNSRDQISTRDLRYGGGIGLHADTLIGPMRLDAGFGEDRRFQVYFSAGFDF